VTDEAAWSDGQRLAVQQLRALADGDDGLQVLNVAFNQASQQLEISLSVPLDGWAPGPGIRLRERESFVIVINGTFPFAPPSVSVRHRRWSGTPHVQWGRLLCLYAAPSTEWVPSDGMRGLIERLLLWLERAAAGTLDTDGVPVHPPVAYGSKDSGRLVVRADLGNLVPWNSSPSGGPTALVALCTQDGERLDVVDWMSATEYWQRVAAGSTPKGPKGLHLVAAAAVMLTADIGFEYPTKGAELLSGLADQGLSAEQLLELMGTVAYGNVMVAKERGIPAPSKGEAWPQGPGGVPQMVIVGTPSREVDGARVAHLVAWRLDALSGQVTDLIGDLMTEKSERFDEIRARATEIGRDWLNDSSVRWARVFEDRAETTRRRDTASAATWLHGKRILVLGCGALGAPVAEAVVRAGARDVQLIDNGIVTPGILVRQPYDDADIGEAKALVLARRLRRSARGARIEGATPDAVSVASRLHSEGDEPFDLVIDATADSGVRSALERRRATNKTARPAQLTLVVGHQARRGIVTVSRAGTASGGYDVLRRLGIAARGPQAAPLADIASDLYPRTPRSDVFMPEPGCSAPTFTGSHAEASALAASLLSAGLDALTDSLPGAPSLPMAAAAVRLEPTDDEAQRRTGTTWVGWPNDHVLTSADGAFQVRLSHTALATLRAEARRGARMRGARVETGGMLLGEIDEAAGVAFIDVATPPTPDSLCAATHFEHGVDGSQDLVDHHTRSTARVTSFAGMWHTHPGGPAAPSSTDEAGMANLVTPVLGGPPRCLMLIAGGPDPAWSNWLEACELTPPPQLYARVVDRHDRRGSPPPQPARPPGRYFLASEPIGPAGVLWWRRWRGGPR